VPEPSQKQVPDEDELHAGHFFIDPAASVKALASQQAMLPALVTMREKRK
jgi:hypothetical protein